MRELEIGEHILIEDYQSVVLWRGNVARAGGNLVVITDEQAPPVDLKPNLPVRVCFSEQRWLSKARGRVLERDGTTVKFLLVGGDERIQRRRHVRVGVGQEVDVLVTSRDAGTPLRAELLDVSEGGFQLASAVAFATGDSVQLTCVLNGTSVRLAGQVVREWSGGDRRLVGVRASGLSPAARSAVARFVIEQSLAAGRNGRGTERALDQSGRS